MQNAPTQSLLSIATGILDDSIERNSGEVPQVLWLLTILIILFRWMLLCLNGLLQKQMHTLGKPSDLISNDQRVACLLRKVVLEIERRISTQSEHLRTVFLVFHWQYSKLCFKFLLCSTDLCSDISLCSKTVCLKLVRRSINRGSKFLKP